MRISDWSSDVCSSDLAYRIVRLKDKLGTRSMASGEIVMDGALAWMIGPPGQGFVQMAEMINQSRLSNAVRSAGMMRRALREALAVARGRRSEEHTSELQSLMRNSYAVFCLKKKKT